MCSSDLSFAVRGTDDGAAIELPDACRIGERLRGPRVRNIFTVTDSDKASESCSDRPTQSIDESKASQDRIARIVKVYQSRYPIHGVAVAALDGQPISIDGGRDHCDTILRLDSFGARDGSVCESWYSPP